MRTAASLDVATAQASADVPAGSDEAAQVRVAQTVFEYEWRPVADGAEAVGRYAETRQAGMVFEYAWRGTQMRPNDEICEGLEFVWRPRGAARPVCRRDVARGEP